MLSRHSRCALSCLRCNGHSPLLNSYLSIIENPSCSACSHPSQDTYHLILHCPDTDSAPLALCKSLSLYDLWSRTWEVARLLGLLPFRHAPIPRKGSGNNYNIGLLSEVESINYYFLSSILQAKKQIGFGIDIMIARLLYFRKKKTVTAKQDFAAFIPHIKRTKIAICHYYLL